MTLPRAYVLNEQEHGNSDKYDPYEDKTHTLPGIEHSRGEKPSEGHGPDNDPCDPIPGALYLFHGK